MEPTGEAAVARYLPAADTHTNTPAKVLSGRGEEGAPTLGPGRGRGERTPHVSLAGRTLPPATLRRRITDTGDPPQRDGGMKKGSLLLPDDFHIVGVQKCVQDSVWGAGVGQRTLKAPLQQE